MVAVSGKWSRRGKEWRAFIALLKSILLGFLQQASITNKNNF